VKWLFALLVTSVSPGILWAGWDIQSIDTGGKTTVFSFSIDKNDNAHISWYRAGVINYLKYQDPKSVPVLIDSGTWMNDGDLAISVNKDGQPNLAYCNENNKHLEYAHLSDGTWEKEIVVNQQKGYTLPPCSFVSVAVDNSGSPRIVFSDTNTGALKYAKLVKGKWFTQDIDLDGQMSFAVLAFNAENIPAVAYYDVKRKQLKYARDTGIDWSTSTICNEPAGRSLSIGFVNLAPEICYFSVAEEQTLKLANWGGKGWRNLKPKCLKLVGSKWEVSSADLKDDTIAGGTIVIDKQGVSHIAYLSRTENTIVYAKKTNKGWQAQTLAQVQANSIPKLVINDAGLPRIIYPDKGGLKYLVYREWNCL